MIVIMAHKVRFGQNSHERNAAISSAWNVYEKKGTQTICPINLTCAKLAIIFEFLYEEKKYSVLIVKSGWSAL